MRKLTFALACIVVLARAGAAEAQVLQRYNTGQWLVEANATRGTFQNCTATGTYGGGAKVMLMLTRNMVWGVGIDNPTWNWAPQSQGDITYRVDSRRPRSSRARALSRTRLLIVLADSRRLFEEIRRGSRMNFRPHGHAAFGITLRGTSVALNELVACIRRYR